MYRRRLSWGLAVLVAAAGVGACASPTPTSPQRSASKSTASAPAGTPGAGAEQVLAANTAPTAITLTADTSDATAVDLSRPASGSGVSVSGSTVTLTRAATYVLSGTLAGSVVVRTSDKGQVTVVLSGASITSPTGSALAVTDAQTVLVYLAAGTTSTLTDATSYSDTGDNAPNAALFSSADTAIAGPGALTVTGRANDGITSKDGLLVASGAITVTAKDDGVRGKDYLVVSGGAITVTSGGDGLKSDNESKATLGYVAVEGGDLTITSGDDGIAAFTDAVVSGGTLSITSGGGHTATPPAGTKPKGVTSGSSTVIGGGTLTIDAADDAVHSDSTVTVTGGSTTVASGDDGVHADTDLTIAGGTVDVTASYEGVESTKIHVTGGRTSIVSADDGVNGSDGSGQGQAGPGRPGGSSASSVEVDMSGGTVVVDAGGDGFDANGRATITGGTLVVSGPTANDNGALDVDSTFLVNGGTVIAVGSSGMLVAPSDASTQTWLAAAFTTQQAGVLQVVSGSTVLTTFTSTKTYASVVYSSADLTGTSYDVYVNGQASGSATGPYSVGGSLTGASKVATVSVRTAPAGGFGRR